MIIRGKAPLRLGLAGGGTDVSPYSDLYGGAILNATINLFAYTTIEPRDDGKIIFESPDRNLREEYNSSEILPTDGDFILHKGVYNRIVKDYTHKALSFKLTTYVDAPPGSGLGTSSTLMVSILGAFTEWCMLPLGEYEIANLAYTIERLDLKMAGGKQDQYAATFGGFNYMEFYKDDKVIVNPLRIKQQIQDELSHNLLLYYTQTNRKSANIIEQQTKNVVQNKQSSIEAMHKLKEQSIMMKESLLIGDIDKMGDILDFGWKYKKLMTKGITNTLLNEIYTCAINSGATGGKVSGAGGGGFMTFYCPNNTKYAVKKALEKFGGCSQTYGFTNSGLTTWKI